MNILITSAGKRVSLIKAFKSELKCLCPEGKVYTTDINPDYAPACHVSDGAIKVKRIGDAAYMTDLLAICKQNSIRLLIPTIDTELLTLAKNKMMFAEHGIHIVISSSIFVQKCRDKRIINDFFLKNGIDIPKQFDKDNLQFPMFVKPFDGSLSVDTYLIKSREELTEYHFANEKLMFMEYIDPSNFSEFTVDMYYGRDSIVKCIIPRKRIETRAGEISKGLTLKNSIVEFLKDRLNKIEGACGCLTLQLFFNARTNQILGIEINPRFGGGFPLSYLAGGNYPRWLILEYLMGEELTYRDDWESELLMLRYDDEIIVHGFKS